MHRIDAILQQGVQCGYAFGVKRGKSSNRIGADAKVLLISKGFLCNEQLWVFGNLVKLFKLLEDVHFQLCAQAWIGCNGSVEKPACLAQAILHASIPYRIAFLLCRRQTAFGKGVGAPAPQLPHVFRQLGNGQHKTVDQVKAVNVWVQHQIGIVSNQIE